MDAAILFAVACRLTAYVDAARGECHTLERFACLETLIDAVTNPRDGNIGSQVSGGDAIGEANPAYLPPDVARILLHGIARTALRCAPVRPRACAAMASVLSTTRKRHSEIDESDRLALGDVCHAVVCACSFSAEAHATPVLKELIAALTDYPVAAEQDEGKLALRSSFPLPCRMVVSYDASMQSTPTLNMHVDESQCGDAKSAVAAFNMLRKAGINPPSWDVQVRLLAWRRMRHFDAMQARRERGLNRADAAPSVQLKENVDS